MPKYHLVSDVLQDLVIDDEGAGHEYVLPLIWDAWTDGKIKLLCFSPESPVPQVWEPSPKRQITLGPIGSGKRWITCRISQGIQVLVKDPHISEEDIQYLAERAVEAGLILAEPFCLLTEMQPSQPDHCVPEPLRPAPNPKIHEAIKSVYDEAEATKKAT